MELFELTPVEKIGDLYFKREDKFLPDGPRSINGTKLRQLIWLVGHQVAITPNIKGIIYGTVTGSPQHAYSAWVANHYGLDCIGVISAIDIDKYKNLKYAEQNGVEFIYSKVGYAKTLEAKAFQLQKEHYPDYYLTETNIVVNNKRNNPQIVRRFHNVGAVQAANIPDHIETLIIPCGSGTSTISILYGLYLNKPKNLKKIVLMGIGNVGSNNIGFIWKRLDYIDPFIKMYLREFDFVHYNLNGTGYCKYEQLFKEQYNGVVFHPRYEAKCWRYLKEYHPELLNDKTLFWIIGSDYEV
jgi:1-aminocyclopropane-1-carboxylate deaminase/D-cysteine desulfhydrase-like pyridoxal-dependent ACC family enzyme